MKQTEFSGIPKPAVLNGCMCQDGECESCKRLVEAFEAMREALHCTTDGLEAFSRLHPGPCSITTLPMAFDEYAKIGRAALALADGVSK